MHGKTYTAKLKWRLSRALVALIALLVLNCSVDTAYDPVPMKWNGEEYTEDLSFNDIESVYELVAECLLDMDDDFVPEQDDNDGYEIGKTLKDWTCTTPAVHLPFFHRAHRLYPTHIEKQYPLIAREICLPPPDHSC